MKIARKRRQFFLFFFDFLILYGTLYLTLIIRKGNFPNPISWRAHVEVFSFAFCGWAIIFYTAGLYILESLYLSIKFAMRLFWAISFSTLLTALMFYLRPDAEIAPKTVLFLFASLAYLGIFGWRCLYTKIARRFANHFSIAFIGASNEVSVLTSNIEKQPYHRYSIVFIYDEEGVCPVPKLRTLSTPAELNGEIEKHMPDLFVLAKNARLEMETRRLLFGLIGERARFISLPDFYESILRRVPVDAINDTWFLENIDLMTKKTYLIVKGFLDRILAIIAILITAPMCLFIMVSIVLESKGSVIFKQTRLGEKNNPFTIYKFRTMRTEKNNFSPTSLGDSRITKLGKFLRASRLDELPQLINIIRGDMSFIGPRPERPELAEMLAKAIPYYMQRHLLKPGITGWDQVSGEYHSPSIEDTYKKLQFDLYYIKNLNIFLDISIFFKTIMTMLSRSGR